MIKFIPCVLNFLPFPTCGLPDFPPSFSQVTRNPLLRHRPAFSGLTQDERTHASIFAMSFRHFFHSIAYGYTDKHNRELQPRILDPRLAQAWLWATTREFTVEEVASLLEADRNRLTSYLEDCLDGMFKVVCSTLSLSFARPQKLIRVFHTFFSFLPCRTWTRKRSSRSPWVRTSSRTTPSSTRTLASPPPCR